MTGGEEEVSSAASFLIREWVEKLLGVKFETLPGEQMFTFETSFQKYFSQSSDQRSTVTQQQM